MNPECTAVTLLAANAENNLGLVLVALVLAIALAVYSAHLFSTYLTWHENETDTMPPTDQRS